MDLEHDFRHFIQQHHLIRKEDRILVAVSGGIDSMVLCHLFKSLETPMAVAHCNFQMRGDASDFDEDLVEIKTPRDRAVNTYSAHKSNNRLRLPLIGTSKT